MQMLSEAHESRFGAPEPTRVPLKVRPGPCILISGHDMADMEALLQATEGTGINVYTHGAKGLEGNGLEGGMSGWFG